jgi:hypothetical protein
MTVTAASRASTGTFAASLSNVTFRAWDQDTDTAVPDGGCYFAPSATINTTF